MASSPPKRPPKSVAAQRAAAMKKANERRTQIAELKRELRAGQLDLGGLLRDPRAQKVPVLRLMPMLPRCGQRTALQALMLCQINGADNCGDLSESDRQRLCQTLVSLNQGLAITAAAKRMAIGPPPRSSKSSSPRGEGDLDEVVHATRRVVPIVEQKPSEFLRALKGLEGDVLTVRMVERFVAALRFYAKEDDGGAMAHRVLDYWLRLQNYRGRVARGELPPPSLGMPEVE